MKMNPTAIVLWIICSIIGFLVSGTIDGALLALAVSMGISLLAEFL
jgi:hypothetical protein